ncbi:MAG: tRNA (guanosine(37)-N1)-methyltransferase TrmD, partial [Pseudomonadota bacterium]
MSGLQHIGVVSLFADEVERIGQYGVIGRAISNGAVTLDCRNPRDYAEDQHRTVDDRPFGGGPGMVMQYAPWVAAIRDAKAQHGEALCVAMSPQGRRFDQAAAQRMSALPAIVFVAGRYEGFDERIIEAEIDEEWSLGDFVLSGGELAAMSMIDSVVRLKPGVLGHDQSAALDSFADGLLEHPHYTRPAEIEGRQVPAVLQSGDHGAITRWRRREALGRTWLRRPDLLAAATLSEQDLVLLEEFKAAHR